MKKTRKPKLETMFECYLYSSPNNTYFGNIILSVDGKSRKVGNFNVNAGIDLDLFRLCLTSGLTGSKLDRVETLPEITSVASSKISGKKVKREKVQEDRQVQNSVRKKVFRKSRRFV